MCPHVSPLAQSFGRVGTPGAVVWIGYSWKDGPKAAWGSLLQKLVTDFKSGGLYMYLMRVHQGCQNATQCSVQTVRSG